MSEHVHPKVFIYLVQTQMACVMPDGGIAVWGTRIKSDSNQPEPLSVHEKAIEVVDRLGSVFAGEAESRNREHR